MHKYYPRGKLWKLRSRHSWSMESTTVGWHHLSKEYYCKILSVSSPDPILCEGKGSGDWAKASSSWRPSEEFALPNQIAASAHSYDSRMWKRHCPLYEFESPTRHCWPIRSELCSRADVLAHAPRAGQTKITVQSVQTISSRRGWGVRLSAVSHR